MPLPTKPTMAVHATSFVTVLVLGVERGFAYFSYKAELKAAKAQAAIQTAADAAAQALQYEEIRAAYAANVETFDKALAIMERVCQ